MPGYKAQIAVDFALQMIVAAAGTQETNDKKQLLPMIALLAANLEQKPESRPHAYRSPACTPALFGSTRTPS